MLTRLYNFNCVVKVALSDGTAAGLAVWNPVWFWADICLFCNHGRDDMDPLSEGCCSPHKQEACHRALSTVCHDSNKCVNCLNLGLQLHSKNSDAKSISMPRAQLQSFWLSTCLVVHQAKFAGEPGTWYFILVSDALRWYNEVTLQATDVGRSQQTQQF